MGLGPRAGDVEVPQPTSPGSSSVLGSHSLGGVRTERRRVIELEEVEEREKGKGEPALWIWFSSMEGGDVQHPRRPGPVESPGCGSVPDDEEPPCAAPISDPGEGGVSGGLAKAIASVLGGVLEDYDAKTEAVTRSQDVLGLSLDRLTGGTLPGPSDQIFSNTFFFRFYRLICFYWKLVSQL